MLFHIIAESSVGNEILDVIELISIGIETLAVLFIAVAVGISTFNYFYRNFARLLPDEERYKRFRTGLGRSLLLGLEMLIAADVVRTVALEATLDSILVLGLLVLIRTFLSWSLVVEIEGRWPWQPSTESSEE